MSVAYPGGGAAEEKAKEVGAVDNRLGYLFGGSREEAGRHSQPADSALAPHLALRSRLRDEIPEGAPMKRYDVFSRFARRHLGTQEERAVYLTLVGQEAESWSARELAERNHLGLDAIARVLEAFEAAGVVDAFDARGAHRYRWRSDMNYLIGEEGHSPGWVDPVCGMPVLPNSPYVADDAYRRPRRFCSSLCLAAFLASPSTFSGPAPVGVR